MDKAKLSSTLKRFGYSIPQQWAAGSNLHDHKDYILETQGGQWVHRERKKKGKQVSGIGQEALNKHLESVHSSQHSEEEKPHEHHELLLSKGYKHVGSFRGTHEYALHTRSGKPKNTLFIHSDGSWSSHNNRRGAAQFFHKMGGGFSSQALKEHLTSSQHSEEEQEQSSSSPLGLYLHTSGPPLGAAINYDEPEGEAFSDAFSQHSEESEAFGEYTRKSQIRGVLDKHGYNRSKSPYTNDTGYLYFKHPNAPSHHTISVAKDGSEWEHFAGSDNTKSGKTHLELDAHLKKHHASREKSK